MNTINKKIIKSIRSNEKDSEITTFLEEDLKERFLMGFLPSQATSVVQSYFMVDSIGSLDNQAIIDLIQQELRINPIEMDGEVPVHKSSLWDFECSSSSCKKDIQWSLREIKQNCPFCKAEINLNTYMKDASFVGFYAEEVYENYIKNKTRKIYSQTLEIRESKLKGQSDIDVFKEICKTLGKDYGIRFHIHPWSEGGNISWLYSDPLKLEEIYSEDWNIKEDLRIDTDSLLYLEGGKIYVKSWFDRVVLNKLFNGKIVLTEESPIHIEDFGIFYIVMDLSEMDRIIPDKKKILELPLILLIPLFFTIYSFEYMQFKLKQHWYGTKWKIKYFFYSKVLKIKDEDIPLGY